MRNNFNFPKKLCALCHYSNIFVGDSGLNCGEMFESTSALPTFLDFNSKRFEQTKVLTTKTRKVVDNPIHLVERDQNLN